jgi:hypothetical protein
LPSFGLLVYSSVTDASNTLGQGNGLAWLPDYGISDIIDSSVTIRRQVRLQGNLRIDASYFREAPDWQISKQQREQMAQTPPSQWKNYDRWNGGQVVAEI